MAILEKEVWVELNGNNLRYYEDKMYDIPRRRDKWGTLTVPKSTKILVKINHLKKGSHIKLTKICDHENCDIEGGRHVKEVQYRAILKGREDNEGKDLCHKCSYARRGRLRKENVKYQNSLEFFAKENDKYFLLDEFSQNNEKEPKDISKSTHDKYLWNCFNCGEKNYQMSVANRTGLNQNCPKCAGNIKKTTENYKQEVFDLVGEEYEVMEEYINTRSIIKMKHVICNNIYPVTPNNFLRGKRCPICSESKGEKRIREWLVNNNIQFESQKEFDGLIGVGGGNLSFDFYLLNQNILIEYQGEFHDGSNGEYTAENLKNQKEHDYRKKKFAEQEGKELLEIWYWDFDSIEVILNGKLGGVE